MIDYRTFDNFDPPRIAALWNAALAGRRTAPVPPRATTVLEYFLFAKPYFDPRGTFLAMDGRTAVGLVMTGFGPTPDRSGLDTSTGVVCLAGVHPDYRRKGVGSELLRRAEAYMRDKGAKTLVAGPMHPDNPFTFGLYGGCDSGGFLAGDAASEAFFAKHGYRKTRTVTYLQRSLDNVKMPADPRFLELRGKYDITFSPFHKAGWYREGALGPVEVVEYRLTDKITQEVTARILLWVMELFSHHWSRSTVGVFDLQVVPEHRRQGKAKFLLVHTLRYLQDQPFELIEAMCDEGNASGLELFKGLGFEAGDTAVRFEKGA